MVQAYDVETGQALIADVTATNHGEADHYYLINDNLKVTPPHPFFTAEGHNSAYSSTLSQFQKDGSKFLP